MRRTAFMVLVLGLSFAMTANGSSTSLAKAVPTAPSPVRHATQARPHGVRRTTQHSSAQNPGHTSGHARAAAHATRHSVRCKAARATGRQACGKTLAWRPGQRLQQRHLGNARIPRAELKTADLSTRGPSAPATEAGRADSANDAVEEKASIAVTQPASLSRKHAVMPPPMRGSLDSLERQNEKADDEGLERIEDEDDLADRIAHKLLVPVPASASLTVNGNLPENHRYCRPWTAHFLADLARAHASQFHGPLEVSSAVRTVEYQKHLMAVNGNAAAAEGDVVSPHLTGATIDIAKSGLSRQEIGWMRSWLLPLQSAGKIDVEEEFHQACFHITVYESYVPRKPATSGVEARDAQPGGAVETAPATGPPGAAQKKMPQKSRQSDTDAGGGATAHGR
jgi:hypothetical protein